MTIAPYADMHVEERTQKRIDLLVSFGRQRDAILNAPVFDLAAARALVQAYEVAKMSSCATDLQKRVEHYEQQLEAEKL
jgi:hypothetical protein